MGDMNDQEEAPGPGPWMQDRAHLPASVTPLLQEIYPRVSAGFSAALSPTACSSTPCARARQRVSYVQPVPFDAPGPTVRSRLNTRAEIGRRTLSPTRPCEPDLARHPEVLGRRGKAAPIARHRELRGRPSSLSDEELQPTSISAWITCRRCGSSTIRTTAPHSSQSVTSSSTPRAGRSVIRCRSSCLRRLVAGVGCAQPRDHARNRGAARIPLPRHC
jgi:hypothetical protein